MFTETAASSSFVATDTPNPQSPYAPSTSMWPAGLQLALASVVSDKGVSHPVVLLGGDMKTIRSFQNGLLNYAARRGASRRPRKLGGAIVTDGSGNIVEGFTCYIRATETDLCKAFSMQYYLDRYAACAKKEYSRDEDGIIVDITVTNEREMTEAADGAAAVIVAALPKMTVSKVVVEENDEDEKESD